MEHDLDKKIFENPEEYSKGARIAMEIRINCEGLRLNLKNFLEKFSEDLSDDDLERITNLYLGCVKNTDINDQDLRKIEEVLGINKNYLTEISQSSLDDELHSIMH
jgi:hypothetical protein